ncbi:MAG: transcription factor [Candidatus Bathyarchaeia archaeon]
MVEDDFLLTAVSKIDKEAVKIVKELTDRGKATEDELARATGLKINEIRKILFKLNSFSLAFSDTVQDKKTGWMIFYWRIQSDQIEGVIRTQKKRILEKLKARQENEKSHDFYWCRNDNCARRAFEDAMETLFKCPTCGKRLDHFDNAKVLEIVGTRVDMLKKELTSE